MIWQNLLAFFGLATLALPVFIHLLSRKRAVRQKFPSLRFLNATRLNPVRSPNLTDIPLLIVRCAIFALAVLALAQPLFLSAERRQSFNSSLARLIVVDTSAAMLRAGVGGKSAADSARALATTLAAEAKSSLIITTASPSSALSGASAWLEAQHLRGDVVVLSDFRYGAIDSAAISQVDRRFGVKLVRVARTAAPADAGVATTRGTVSATVDSLSTRGEWTNASSLSDSGVTIFAPENMRSVVEAAARAAKLTSPHTVVDTARHVAVLISGATQTAEIEAAAKPIDAAWMADAIIAVREQQLLADAIRESSPVAATFPAAFTPILRNGAGRPIVGVAKSNIDNRETLVFHYAAAPSELGLPALLVALDGLRSADAVFNAEVLSVSDAELAKLERPAEEVGSGSADAERAVVENSGMSDARWFWALVLVLLAVETVMRRRADANSARELAA